MAIGTCRSTPVLKDYLLGQLTEADSVALERHLRDCSRCEETLAKLDRSSDVLVRHLRLQPESSGDAGSEGWAACMKRLRSLPPAAAHSSPPVSPSSDEFEPPAVHHYKLLETLGRGGMGVVYRAWHPQLHRAVAIKLLPATRAGDATAVARFQREMRTSGGLDHPAIVRALDAGVADGAYYLVMEFVDGVDLSRLVRRCGPFGVDDACQAMVDAAEALHHAHQRHVIHRDVKPSNLMLTRQGQVKILDFGLARIQPLEVNGQDTTAGRVLGTLDFLSPEQASGLVPVSACTDIYGLGATLFKLLTGTPPHGAEKRPLLEQLQKIINEPAPDLRQLRNDISDDLAAIVARALSLDPEDRHSSAQEFADDLKPFAASPKLADLAREAVCMEEVSGKAVSPSTSLDSLEKSPPDRQDRSERTPASTSGRRLLQPPLLAIMGVLLGVLLGWAGVTLWLQTGEASLMIVSEVDDVALHLLQDEKPVREVQVSLGENETTIRAGRYELRIAGTSNRVHVDHEAIQVLRGDRAVVRVVRQAAPPPAAAQADWRGQLQQRRVGLRMELERMLLDHGEQHPAVVRTRRELELLDELSDDSPDSPTFQGRTFKQWLRILQRETDPPTIAQAIESLVQLDTAQRQPETVEALFQAIVRVSDLAGENWGHPVQWIWLGEGDKPDESRDLFAWTEPPWREVADAFVRGLRELSDDYVAQAVDQAMKTENRPQQQLAVAYIASMGVNPPPLQDGEELAVTGWAIRALRPPQPIPSRWLKVLQQLAASSHTDVRAACTYVLIVHGQTPPPAIKAALNDAESDVALAAFTAVIQHNPVLYPREAGTALGRLMTEFHSGDRGKRLATLFFRPLSHQLRAEHQGGGTAEVAASSREIVAAAGQTIVSLWRPLSGNSELTHPYMIECGGLAAMGVLDEETKRLASTRLHELLGALIAQRKQAPATAGNDTFEDPLQGVYGATMALIYLDGWLPDEILANPPSAETELGAAFEKWRSSLNEETLKYASDDRLRMMTWYPLAYTRALMITQGGIYSRNKQAASQTSDPRLQSMPAPPPISMPIEWMLCAYSTAPDNLDLQYSLALEVSRMAQSRSARSLAVRLPRLMTELVEAARNTSLQTLRSDAMKVALRSGLVDDQTVQFARETLAQTDEPDRDDDWVLEVFAGNPQWEPTPEEAGEIVALVRNSFLASSRPGSSRPGSSRGTLPVSSGVSWIAGLNSIAQLGPKARGASDLLVQIFDRRGRSLRPRLPSSGQLSPRYKTVFGFIGMPPEVYLAALDALVAVGEIEEPVLESLRYHLAMLQKTAPSPRGQTEEDKQVRAVLQKLNAILAEYGSEQ